MTKRWQRSGKVQEWVTRHRRRGLMGLAALAAVWVFLFMYHLHKPLPPGIAVAGPVRRAPVEFLYDLTYQRGDTTVVDQTIFDRVFAMIDSADQFIVLDMFLFNAEHGGERDYRPITAQLTARLLARHAASPDLLGEG